MSAKAIREASGKHLLNQFLTAGAAVKSHVAPVTADTDWTALTRDNPWLLSEVSHWCSLYMLLNFITILCCETLM